MKQALVQTLTQSGNTYGQVSNPDDLMKSQGFAHDRISQAVQDFVNRGTRAEVAGFNYTLGSGTAFTMLISLPGRVWTPDGISYDLGGNDASRTLTFDAAHETLPRLDIVVARIEDEVDEELNLIPFVRVRTPEEHEDSVPPYPPQNLSAATERHWKATVAIVKGTAALSPTRPTLAANEIALYEVGIGAGLTNLAAAAISDVRNIPNTIRMLTDQFAQSLITMSNFGQRLAAVEDLGGRPIDLSQIFGEIRSLEEILADLAGRTASAADLPEIKYARPKYALSDKRTAQILADSHYTGGQSVVDIETGAVVNFGDAEVAISPTGFVDPDLNARFVKLGSDPGHVQRTETLTLNDVTQISSDGPVGFSGLGAHITPARENPACAARDGRYIEIFGGMAFDGNTPLGDWYTYDSLNNTVTQRTLTGDAIPNSAAPAMFPYGDGTNVLVMARGVDNTTKWFRVNCSTWVSTEITTTKPTQAYVQGDLIAAGKIFIVAGDGLSLTHFWEYSTSTHTFAQLSVTGTVPAGGKNLSQGCFYKENQYLHQAAPEQASSQKTYIFDRTTLVWTQITVLNQPFDFIPSTEAQSFQIANIGGRPTMVGGFFHANQGSIPDQSFVWELIPSVLPPGSAPGATRPLTWTQTSGANVPPRQSFGMCSSLGEANLPNGKGFAFNGRTVYGGYVSDTLIYGTARRGLIAAVHNGVTGISIGENSTLVQFEVDPFTAAYALAAYRISLTGSFTGQNVKIEGSWDNGAHWHVIESDKTWTVTDSATPGVRRLRITLYRGGSNPPILTGFTEGLDEDGGEIEDRMVVRFDCPPITFGQSRYLYIDRLGRVTLENTATPSTPSKAIIMRIKHDDGTGDDNGYHLVISYINRRRPVVKYYVEHFNGIDLATGGHFINELAVPVRYVRMDVVEDGTGALYRKATDPTIEFNQVVILAEDAGGSNDDGAIIELFG